MEISEIIVYLILAIVTGSIILFFVMDLESQDIYEANVNDDFSNKLSYTKKEFISNIPQFWEDCLLGEMNKTYTVHIKGHGNLSKSEIIKELKVQNIHSDLDRSDIVLTRIALPTVTRIMCTDGKIILTQKKTSVVLEQDNDYTDCYIDDNNELQCSKPKKDSQTRVVVGEYENGTLIGQQEIIIPAAGYFELPVEATYINSANPSQNYYKQDLKCGKETSKNRIVMEIDIPSYVPNEILDAELVLYKKAGNQEPIYLQAYPIDESWTLESATWNSWSTHGGSYATKTAETEYENESKAKLNITNQIQTWLLQPDLNNGLLLKTASETTNNHKIFFNQGTRGPRIAIWYRP